jgi:hypothetical protein
LKWWSRTVLRRLSVIASHATALAATPNKMARRLGAAPSTVGFGDQPTLLAFAV